MALALSNFAFCVSSSAIGQQVLTSFFRGTVVKCGIRPGSARVHPRMPVRMTLAERDTAVETEKQKTKEFSWTEQWYPVEFVENFDKTRPFGFNAWDKRLVAYYEKSSGKYVVLDDVCPHRAAPLSEGRVRDHAGENGMESVLECGYHGWAFSCSGQCVAIPQLTAQQSIPAAASLKRRYPTAVRRGLIFAWVGVEKNADDGKLPVEDEKEDASKQFAYTAQFQNSSRVLPYDYFTMMENLLDPEHVFWAHHGQPRFDRSMSSPHMNMRVVENDPERGYMRAIQTGESHIDKSNPTRTEVVRKSPFFVSITTFTPDFGELGFNFVCAPDGGTSSRLFVFLTACLYKRNLVYELFTKVPRWMQHLESHSIVDGDTALLWSQTRALQRISSDGYGGAWRQAYVLATNSHDTLVLTYRKWLDEHVHNVPLRSAILPEDGYAKPKELLLERYHSHTATCKVCMGALTNLRRLQLSAKVTAGLSASYLLSAVAFTAVAGTAASTLSPHGALDITQLVAALPGQFKASLIAAAALIPLCLTASAAIGDKIDEFIYSEKPYNLAHSD